MMRLFVFTSAILSIAAISASAVFAETLPARKAGLWEQKTVMDEGGGPREQTMKICIDAAMEQNTIKASMEDHKRKCTKYEVKVVDGVTVAEGDCRYDTRNVTSRTEMSGDFEKEFNIKISSRTSDATGKQSIVVKRTITQQGTYLGESCGDLKGGEAMASDGTRMLVQ